LYTNDYFKKKRYTLAKKGYFMFASSIERQLVGTSVHRSTFYPTRAYSSSHLKKVDSSQETASDKTTREWNKFSENCSLDKENAISSRSYSQPPNTGLVRIFTQTFEQLLRMFCGNFFYHGRTKVARNFTLRSEQGSNTRLEPPENIYDAIDKGDLMVLKNYYHGLKDWNSTDPLLYALSKNQIKIANYLLTLDGYDINGFYRFDTKPLLTPNSIQEIYCLQPYNSYNLVSPAFLAVALKDLELLKFLIDKGADCSVSASTNKDRNHIADINVSPSNYLTGAMINPLMLSIANNFEEGFNLIINTQGVNGKIDLNAMNINMTPLILAISQGRKKMAEKLIKSGVDVNLAAAPSGFDRVNPLEFAIMTRQPSFLEKLLEAGADPKLISNIDGYNLWHLAAQYGNSSNIKNICQILSSQEGFRDMINDRNPEERKTPLDVALECDKDFAVEALMHHGAECGRTRLPENWNSLKKQLLSRVSE
jgi:ankyrin repeat protein